MPDYICSNNACVENPAHRYGRFRADGDVEKCPWCNGVEFTKSSKNIFNFGASYSCLECGSRSDYKEKPDFPECLYCACEDVCWIPPKFASSSHVDQTLKRIAQRYGLSDMGQRGGTRPGEAARQAKIQPTIERKVNVGGFEVPVTKDGSVMSTWSNTSLPTRMTPPGAGTPFAGLSKPKAIPTRVVHNYTGKE